MIIVLHSSLYSFLHCLEYHYFCSVMLSNLSNGVHVQDKITINLSAKNQYDEAYKSIVPDTGIMAVQAARRTHHQFTKSL